MWEPIEPKLLRRIHDRLTHTGGCETVRYEPSRLAPNEVVCRIDPVTFLERGYTEPEARLRIEFALGDGRPHYWIQWWEPDAGRGFGWHADETEPEYGPAHLQIERPDGGTDRRAADHVEDEHPYRTFERRFTAIPEIIADLGWT